MLQFKLSLDQYTGGEKILTSKIHRGSMNANLKNENETRIESKEPLPHSSGVDIWT